MVRDQVMRVRLPASICMTRTLVKPEACSCTSLLCLYFFRCAVPILLPVLVSMHHFVLLLSLARARSFFEPCFLGYAGARAPVCACVCTCVEIYV